MDTLNYREILEQSSAVMAVVNPDFKVLSASDGFLDITKNDRENIIGQPILNVFPEIGENIEEIFKYTLHSSLTKVLESKKTDTTRVVRYDIPITDSENGGFDVRYWKTINTPILDNNNAVKYIKQIFVDVTHSEELTSQLEREKHNLDAYKTAEQYISKAFKQAPAPVCVLRGPKHVFELVNREFLRIVANKEIIGKPARKAMPELEGQGFFEILDKVYETEKSYAGSEIPATFNLTSSKKVDVYIDFVFQILYDTNGNKDGIFILGTDVTKQVKARKKVEESEYKYRMLIKESAVATALYTGRDIVVQYANDIMLDYWGKDQTAVGKPLIEAVPELKGQNFIDKLKDVYATGRTYSGVEEEAQLKVNGQMKTGYFSFNYKALRDKEGKIYGIHHTAIDVTEQVLAKRKLQENERTLRQLLDSMPQKISHTDSEGNVVFFNQQWVNETGYTLEELQNNGWIETIHHDDFPLVKENWVNAVESDSDLEFECRIKHKELGYRWNLTRSVPINDINGEVIMWVASNTDIHEHKKQKEILENAVKERTRELKRANRELLLRNEEIEEQKEELLRANKNLESFAYISSHDLQEPLRKIQIFADRILKKETHNLSERGKNYFERIEVSAHRMQVLIEDLLSFSRVNNTGKIFGITSLKKIIEVVKEEFEETISRKNAIIETPELCDVYVISFQFRQLMKNLISNALKFSKPGVPPHIIISGKAAKGSELEPKELEDEQKYCHIVVSDNGIGFEPEYSDRIFEVFKRLYGNDEYPGTGIGLAIVKKIVENHNGIITAKGEPNVGATFDIYLPTE